MAGGIPHRRLHRALPMTTVLRDFGTELFLFSQRHVLRGTGAVEGFVIEDGGMVARAGTVPLVNGGKVIDELLA